MKNLTLRHVCLQPYTSLRSITNFSWSLPKIFRTTLAQLLFFGIPPLCNIVVANVLEAKAYIGPCPKAYLEPSRRSRMELLANVVNGFAKKLH